MEGFSGYLLENVASARVRRSANRAFNALFEGLTPPQKTRRAIRGMLPEPPGGWDAPAMDADGNQRFTAENGRPMTYAEALEYHIRNTFFHDGGRSNPRFEPGVARIAYKELGLWPEGLEDWAKGQRPASTDTASVGRFARILREISASHSDDYDSDLNGMWWMEIYAQFAHGSTGEKYVNEEADGTGSKYRVVWIKNYDEAKKYGRYTEGTQQWCLTQYRKYWNQYTKGNTVKMYFLVSPDIDTVEPVPGPNAPLDEYGLSLIGVGIAPDGTLDNCCTRWNHMHGGSDMALTEEQLCKLLNVRELSDACPPFTDEDRAASESRFEQLVGMAISGNAPHGRKVELLHSFGDVRVYDIPLGAGEHYKIALKSDGTPVIKYPIWDEKVHGDYSMVAFYDPYFGDSGSVPDDERESGSRVIVRYDGASYTSPDDDEDISYDDVLYGTERRQGREGINYGRAYLASETYGDTFMFDVTKMDWTGEDVRVDDVSGNLFLKDGSTLCVMNPDGYKELTDDVYEDAEDFFYGNGFAGCCKYKGSYERSYVLYDDITGELLSERLDVRNVSIIMGKLALHLEYGDGTMELLGVDGKSIIGKGDMTDDRPKIYDLRGGTVKSFFGALSREGELVTADWGTDDDGIAKVNSLVKLKLPLMDIPAGAVVRPVISGNSGIGVLVRNGKKSRARYLSPDGREYPGPYDTWDTKLTDCAALILERDSGAENALHAVRLVPVNIIDPETGIPVFPPEFERKMSGSLRVMLWVKSSRKLYMEFAGKDRERSAFVMKLGGEMKEINPEQVAYMVNHQMYDHIWMSPKFN